MSHPHPVDQLLPARQLVTYGLQHVLVLYAGAVAVPLWQPAPALHGVGSHPLRHTPTLPTRALAPPDKPNWAAAA